MTDNFVNADIFRLLCSFYHILKQNPYRQEQTYIRSLFYLVMFFIKMYHCGLFPEICRMTSKCFEITNMLNTLHWSTLQEKRLKSRLNMFRRITNKKLPYHILTFLLKANQTLPRTIIIAINVQGYEDKWNIRESVGWFLFYTRSK